MRKFVYYCPIWSRIFFRMKTTSCMKYLTFLNLKHVTCHVYWKSYYITKIFPVVSLKSVFDIEQIKYNRSPATLRVQKKYWNIISNKYSHICINKSPDFNHSQIDSLNIWPWTMQFMNIELDNAAEQVDTLTHRKKIFKQRNVFETFCQFDNKGIWSWFMKKVWKIKLIEKIFFELKFFTTFLQMICNFESPILYKEYRQISSLYI